MSSFKKIQIIRLIWLSCLYLIVGTSFLVPSAIGGKSVSAHMLSDIDQKTAHLLKNWATHIVVGAGAAGSVVAARLAENPENKILVLELGPNNYGNPWIETPAKNIMLWDNPDGPRPSPTSLAFKTTKQYGRDYRYPRGNGLGGSTNHHSMIDGRGSAEIYDNIAKLIGDNRWSYDSVLPYFKNMESYNVQNADTQFHGTDGWLQVRKGTIKSPFHKKFLEATNKVTGAPISHDMSGNPIHAAGVGIVDLQVTPEGKRSAAFENLLVPQLNKNNNVIILFNTLVTRVLTEENQHELRATGVECLIKPHAYLADNSALDSKTSPEKSLQATFYAQDEVILSGGAINTPQLLLLSGIGPKDHLEKMHIPVLLDLPGVGSDLMDHQEVGVVYEINPSKMVWPAQAATIIDAIDTYLKQEDNNTKTSKQLKKLKTYLAKFADKTEQKESSGGTVLDWFSGLNTDIGHDLHIASGEGFWFDFDLSSNKPLPNGKLRTDYFRSQYDLKHPDFLRVFHHNLLEVLRMERADGTIRLASTDPTVPPVIDLALYKDDKAVERMARGIKIIRAIIKDPSLKKYYKPDAKGNPREIFPGAYVKTIDQLKEYLKRWSAFGHHISGTAKMGRPNNTRAVVDTELRVFGIPNLRVIDTSVYPFPYLHGYNTARAAYLIGEVGADLIKN